MGITSVARRFRVDKMKVKMNMNKNMNAAMETTLSGLICRNYLATIDASASVVPIVSSAAQLNTKLQDMLASYRRLICLQNVDWLRHDSLFMRFYLIK